MAAPSGTGGTRLPSRTVVAGLIPGTQVATVRDVLAGGQDGRQGGPRTDVLSRHADPHAMHADPHAMLKIAGLPPRRPHLPMSG